MTEYEVDFSEVTGKKINCPEECGLCCLCQPEVIPEERLFFRENYPDRMVTSKPPDRHYALALKKGAGSCVFLENRRCTIYKNRTTYCKQFPYHIYVGERVKIELDLSCRGAWSGIGNDALTEAKSLVADAENRIKIAIPEATAVYKQFYDNCKEAGVISDPHKIRESVTKNIFKFTDFTYLGKIMEASQMEPVMNLDEIQKEMKPEIQELEEAARYTAMDSMATNDPLSAPVYCDENWNWNIFMANEESLEWKLLDDDGNMHTQKTVDINEISLKTLEEGGRKVLEDYLLTLNKRDSFMGSVFSLMDATEYEDNMVNAYCGCMSTVVLDILWRASMLDYFFGTGMDVRGIKESIIFYDMDRLDAPTIGAFV